MSSKSWLQKSGQSWKLKVFYLLVMITIALVALLIAEVNSIGPIPGIGVLGLGAMLVSSGLGATAWLILSIQCPGCGARVAWSIIKTASAQDWFHQLESLTGCPRCAGRG